MVFGSPSNNQEPRAKSSLWFAILHPRAKSQEFSLVRYPTAKSQKLSLIRYITAKSQELPLVHHSTAKSQELCFVRYPTYHFFFKLWEDTLLMSIFHHIFNGLTFDIRAEEPEMPEKFQKILSLSI